MESIRIATSGDAFTTQTIVTNRVSESQPFGALGGMPRICEYLAVRLGMSRVHAEYVLNVAQNAHMITLVQKQSTSNVDCSPDMVATALRYAGASDTERDAVFKAIPDSDAKLAAQIASNTTPPLWIPSTAVGRGGPTHMTLMRALHASQLSAYVVEEDAFQASKGSSVCGFATVTIEKLPEVEIRTLRMEESFAVVKFMEAHTEDAIATARDEVRHCRPAFRWVLEQRLKQLEAGRGDAATPQNEASGGGPSTTAMRIRGGDARPDSTTVRAAKSEGTALHLTVVVGHAGQKGAGQAALQALCRIADQAGMPVLLEALPNQRLPVYYAEKYGFTAVTLGQTCVTQATLAKQGFVVMWREPRDVLLAGAGNGSSSVSFPEALPAAAQTANAREMRYTTRQRGGKQEALHLSNAVAKHLASRLIYNAKNVLMCYASWAKEYARQVDEDVISNDFVKPSEEVVLALEEAEATEQRAARRPLKRAREDDTPDPASASTGEALTVDTALPVGASSSGSRTDQAVSSPAAPITGTVTLPLSPGSSREGGSIVLHLTNCTVNIYMGRA